MSEIEKNLKNLKIPKENLINLKDCEESKESRKSYKKHLQSESCENQNPKCTMNLVKTARIEKKIQNVHKKYNGNQMRIFKNPNIV